MSGFRLKLNGLKNIGYATSLQQHLPFDRNLELEYFFDRRWSLVNVQPMLINTVVIFLVSFPEGECEPMALVYNKKEAWADIEKESTGLTEAVGAAIENHYSERYLRDVHLLN
jgi:hypothetical protein